MKFEKNILYIWVGGSCDYGHKERAGGGAYIAEIFEEESKDGSGATVIDTYTTSDFSTKEFQMIYRAMDHALEKFSTAPDNSEDSGDLADSAAALRTHSFTKIIFLSNVQYIQNYPKPENVEIRILPYHKFSRQKDVHDMASKAMRDLRDARKDANT